jgi:hypothetical protein
MEFRIKSFDSQGSGNERLKKLLAEKELEVKIRTELLTQLENAQP